MKCKILCACALFAFAVASTPAQMKASFSGKCAKPDVVQSVPAGDKDGHIFMIQQGKCESMGQIGDAKSKEGMFSEHNEAMGNHLKAWGVYVETFDSGDKVFYSYQATSTTKDGAVAAGSNKYQITGGTGKMKGMKGSGTCKFTGNSGGGLDYECTGEYTMAGAVAAK
jgi:hypothetical protein